MSLFFRSSDTREPSLTPYEAPRSPAPDIRTMENREGPMDGIGSETRQRLMARMRAEDNWPGKAP